MKLFVVFLFIASLIRGIWVKNTQLVCFFIRLQLFFYVFLYRLSIFAHRINIQYIKTNIYKNIKVKDLVEYLHIDQSYFTKTFKKRFHILPHVYITKARLQYAEFLVKTTNKTITEIVDTLNFTDVYSFSKLFKKEFGLSPTAYRKLIIEENK